MVLPLHRVKTKRESNLISHLAQQVTTCTASTCGQNAQCQVIGGRPVCSCYRGYSGDPLSVCTR